LMELAGLSEPASLRVIRASYQLLGLITFYTTVHSELTAWPVAEGTPAVRAAGEIHTDLEKGFIKAEVIAFDDLVSCGSIAKARERGLLRVEGRSYEVKDGDVLTIRFNP
jgi:ribosome-binding ATPase YchF (GTP1/OBG family)